MAARSASTSAWVKWPGVLFAAWDLLAWIDTVLAGLRADRSPGDARQRVLQRDPPWSPATSARGTMPQSGTTLDTARMRGKIEALCRAFGYDPPIICTPMELVEE